jgi:hypothetical protein
VTPSKRGGLHNAAHYTETSGDRKLTPGPWRWKTHQFNYGEPEYDYLYSIVNGEQVLRPTGTDNPIAVDTEDAGRIAMAEDPVIDHILDERAADLASGPRAEEGVQDWFATRLSTHQPSFGPRGMRRHGASYAIHRSAWNRNSAKFAVTEFQEVRA